MKVAVEDNTVAEHITLHIHITAASDCAKWLLFILWQSVLNTVCTCLHSILDTKSTDVFLETQGNPVTCCLIVYMRSLTFAHIEIEPTKRCSCVCRVQFDGSI